MFIKTHFLYDAGTESAGGNEPVKTKDSIDKQNELRKQLGQEPIPYPEGMEGAPAAEIKPNLSQIEQFRADKVKELTATNAGMTTDEINMEAEKLVLARAAEIETEQEAEKERLRLEQAKENAPAVVKIKSKTPLIPEKTKEDETVDEPEIDEAILLKQLSKKAGKEIKSLDDFLNPKVESTPEDKEKKEQERENAKVAFALQNKILSKKEIEEFISDTKDLQGVAYSFYHTQQKSLDETLTDKEIREQFEEEYGLNEEPESRKFKAGQQQINFIANSIISKKHAKYLNLEGVFSEYENEQNQTSQYHQKVLQLAPAYKKDVDAVLDSIKKFKIGGYEVELEDETINLYRGQMLDPKHSEKLIAQGWTLEQLQTSTRNHAIIDNLEEIFTSVLEADRLKHRAGQRGVIPQKNTTKQEVVMNDAQKEARKELQKTLGMQEN